MKDKIYYFTEKSNDILDLQDDLTIEEIGMYFILKAAYFKNFGELTEANLVQRCRFYGDKKKLIQLARKLFEFKEGDLVNNSWLSQIKGIKDKSNKRKDAANARWQKVKEAEDDKPKKPQNNPKITPNKDVNNNKDLECKSGLEIKIIIPKPKGFTPPTLEEVKNYCQERSNNVDANKFLNFYQSKGWMIGKSKMKDWKASVRTWEKTNEESSKFAQYQHLKPTKTDYNKAILQQFINNTNENK